MSSLPKVQSIITGLVIAAAACDHPPTENVMAPDPGQTINFNTTGAPASASGHAELDGTDTGIIRVEKISFSAIATGEGVSAEGQIQLQASRYIGPDFMMHAEVTCLSVSGNEAWIGAIVRRLDVKEGVTPPPFVGTPAVFVVRDNGEGEGVVDMAALVFFPFTAGADIEHCTQRPVLTGVRAPRPSTGGNIRVVSGQ